MESGASQDLEIQKDCDTSPMQGLIVKSHNRENQTQSNEEEEGLPVLEVKSQSQDEEEAKVAKPKLTPDEPGFIPLSQTIVESHMELRPRKAA